MSTPRDLDAFMQHNCVGDEVKRALADRARQARAELEGLLDYHGWPPHREASLLLDALIAVEETRRR